MTNEQIILNLICSQVGGMKVRDIEETTGFTYKQIMDAGRSLIAKGYQIKSVGSGDCIEGLFLSPYDLKYKALRAI
jgi:hypothetical protein